MSEKLLDILKPQGDCIPEELLIRYAEGKLSGDEARRVEEHISECEFCSDALDGIMQNGNARQFHSQLSAIKKIVHKKVRSREASETFPIMRTLGVAATLLIIAISAWYVEYVVNNNEQKIFSHEFAPYPIPKIENDTQQLAPAEHEYKPVAQPSQSPSDKKNSANSVPKHEEKKETQQTLAAPSPPQEEAVEQPSSIALKDNTGVAPQADRPSLKINSDSTLAFSKSQNSNGPPSQSMSLSESRAAQSQDEIVTGETTSQEVIIEGFRKAMAFYQSNRYAEAIAEFQMVLRQEPNNPAANFYSGVSSLALKNPDEALKYFKKTDYKSGQYYEATLWYQALSYIDKSDKKQAKNLLEKVVKLNGEYQTKAEETLKQL